MYESFHCFGIKLILLTPLRKIENFLILLPYIYISFYISLILKVLFTGFIHTTVESISSLQHCSDAKKPSESPASMMEIGRSVRLRKEWLFHCPSFEVPVRLSWDIWLYKSVSENNDEFVSCQEWEHKSKKAVLS